MSSERSEILYDVYLCSYYDQSSPVSRHYTTGYSVCRKIATLNENEVNTVLGSLDLNVQKTREEIVVTDIASLNAIIEKLKSATSVQVHGELENAYVYIVFKRGHASRLY